MISRLYEIKPAEKIQPKLKYIQSLHDDLYRELNQVMYENSRKGKFVDIYA